MYEHARGPRRGKATETVPSPGQCESKIPQKHKETAPRPPRGILFGMYGYVCA